MLLVYSVCYWYIVYATGIIVNATGIWCMLLVYGVCYWYMVYATGIWCMLLVYSVCYDKLLIQQCLCNESATKLNLERVSYPSGSATASVYVIISN